MHFDKQGGGGERERENKRIKGICASLRCGCQSAMGMVCSTRTAINYGYFIATR